MDMQTSSSGLVADEAVRIRLGASLRTAPDILNNLALDPSLTVRAAVAMNRAASPATDLTLARDADERVRAFLAQKLARLLPDLVASEQASALDHVLAVLTVLVEDEATRVRASITECVKAMSGIPHALIVRLAQDQSVSVSDPVIRLSPLLTDGDLLALLTTLPHAGAARSVAGRSGLSPTVTDAIVAHADHKAIRTLLANPSASIRDATLDHLISQAGVRTDWQEPLVTRPTLSPQAAAALSSIVAAHFLDKLLARADLPPAIAAEIRSRVEAITPPPFAGGIPGTDGELLEMSRLLHAAGALDEACLIDAARRCDRRRMAAQLSIASGVPLALVDRAVCHRSPKALISIVWQAGFSMRVASLAQVLLGQIQPVAMVSATTGGAYPFSEEEMRWQLELLNKPAS